MMKKIAANRSGDTIVEVMLVLAVLGMAIGISYATASRSLLNARQAQENSQATWYAQTQVEHLRLLSDSSTPDNMNPLTNIFLPTSPYCVRNPLSATPIDTNQANCTYPTVPYTVLVYNCNKIPTVGPCTTATGPDMFVVQVTWDDILGRGTDSVTVHYRLHAP